MNVRAKCFASAQQGARARCLPQERAGERATSRAERRALRVLESQVRCSL